jgi:hypothetical protein
MDKVRDLPAHEADRLIEGLIVAGLGFERSW